MGQNPNSKEIGQLMIDRRTFSGHEKSKDDSSNLKQDKGLAIQIQLHTGDYLKIGKG
jgi:hypothetical protein